MAYNIIRPRRGIKSLWQQYKDRIYKNGEMLVESPETGVGSGPVNIKFGDGVTSYEHLPYAVMAPTDEIVEGSKAPVSSDAVLKKFKFVNGTLFAGNTSVTITDESITSDSIFEFYSDVYGVSPKEVVVEEGSITLTFDAQDSDVQVKVRCL